MENIHTKTKLNDVGKMIDYWWNELPKHFENIELDDYVIMPNHIHAIIIIRNDSCGATHRSDACGRTHINPTMQLINDSCGRTHRSAPTLGNIIQWFKTMATNEYIRNVKTKKWPIFVKRIFQINYYEHVIKSEKRYLIIKNYIKNNPTNWENDILFQ
jgi:REP element-mobilizing transposase RayT